MRACRRRIPPLLPLLLAALAGPGRAAEPPVSLDAANLSPVAQVFGLPRLTQGPGPGGATRAGLEVDWASHAVSDRDGAAFVRFDGETRRYTLTAVGRLPGRRAGWWALEAPYVQHTGGTLDDLIDRWHRALGLPRGDRPDRPHNKLLYRVVDDSGQVLLDRTGTAAGPGDLALSAGLPLAGPLSAGLRLEAPTGDADRLLGSGSWDAAGWLAATGAAGATGAWPWHAAGGAMAMTGGDVLPSLQRRWATFARLAGGWRPLPGLVLRAQLDGHTPLYRSPLVPLGSPALELRLGAAWHPGGGYRLAAGFSEDPAVGTAPDITFHLRLSRGRL